MNESQRMIAAVIISLSVLLGFNYFTDHQRKDQTPLPQHHVSSADTAIPVTVAPTFEDRTVALGTKTNRIVIETACLQGSINLLGGRLDDLNLVKYKATTDELSQPVNLLNPCRCEDGYWVDPTWVSATVDSHQEEEGHKAASITKVPSLKSHWRVKDGASSTKLTPETPVTLVWENGDGVLFERVIKVDDHYVFTIEERVFNTTNHEIALKPQTIITRLRPKEQGSSLFNDGPVHNGAVGYISNKLLEIKYDDKEMGTQPFQTFQKGWFGFTDKFWLVNFIPDQQSTMQGGYIKAPFTDTVTRYQAIMEGSVALIAPKESHSYTCRIFAGPKILGLLDDYEEKLSIDHFDLAVDFGWFYFLTKPVFYILEFLNRFLGNLGFAIIVLTLLFKLATLPLTQKMARSQRKMRELAPKLEALKKRHGKDQMAFWQAQKELMQKEKVSAFGGCLPAILQAPIFFCLYKVLFISIEMRHAPFFWWIKDLSAPDTTNLFTLFGLISWNPPSLLHLGIGPIILGLTMWYQQRLSPQTLDPTQARAMLLMPLVFTFLFASFPMGLVLYWTVSNMLSIGQQMWNQRK